LHEARKLRDGFGRKGVQITRRKAFLPHGNAHFCVQTTDMICLQSAVAADFLVQLDEFIHEFRMTSDKTARNFLEGRLWRYGRDCGDSFLRRSMMYSRSAYRAYGGDSGEECVSQSPSR
jgi:hypothetical protein